MKFVFKIVIVVCWFGFLTGQAWGHDFWLEPSAYQPASGSLLTVRWRIGMQFKGKAYNRKQSRINYFVLVSPDGKRRPLTGKEKADPAGRISLQTTGGHVLLFRSHRAYIKLAPKKFESYLRHEGIGHIIHRRETRNERKKAGTEWYSRCAKALLWVGKKPMADNAFAKPLGLPFELVALNNPFHMTNSQPLIVQALHQGKPLVGQVITAYHRQGSKVTEVKGKTDAKGLVKLHLPHTGQWLVKSVYMFRTPKGSKADWESLWASLTFAKQTVSPALAAPASRPTTAR